MAIKQEITGVSGATAEYHRISAASIDYTRREAVITVLSYLDSAKRNEEKEQESGELNRKTLMDELEDLVAAPTEENEARRIELSEQINALPQLTPEDVEPRNIFLSTHTIELPQNTDFDLEFAYGWLKENIYTSSQDC